jgi:ABC-type transporter Mla subunit MlaD
VRGRGSSIAGNPVLIGAATVLVIIVAMFLSYNANAGLPFVPSYQLTLESPSAANLVRGNEVRIGGARVGAVDSIKAKRLQNNTNVALIGLKLERDVKPLPKDSTVIIRPKSALGLKYVEITRGRSDQGFEDGDTMPLSASRPTPVEFDEFTSMFNDDTRTAMQQNLQGFGDAFAGRGESINTALGRAARAAARHPAGGEEPGVPADAPQGASSTSWATPRASSRPPPSRRPACS